MRLFTSSIVCFFAFVIAYSFPFLFYFYCKAKIRQLEHWQRLEQWAIRHGWDLLAGDRQEGDVVRCTIEIMTTGRLEIV